MQIMFRCKHCQQMTVNEDSNDLCMEIDAFEQEIRFICRKCKKQNTIKLSKIKGSEPLPRIGSTRF